MYVNCQMYTEILKPASLVFEYLGILVKYGHTTVTNAAHEFYVLLNENANSCTELRLDYLKFLFIVFYSK